jgi:hypothetical protein
MERARSVPKTRSEKLLVVLWLLIPVVVAGVSVYGWNIGDMRGGILLGFLPVSLITVVSVVIASVIENSVSKFTRWVWLAVSLAALLAAMLFASQPMPDASKGADMLLAYIMVILSFPAGLLAPFVLMAVSSFLWKDGSNLAGLTGMWLCFLVAGYVQWFVLVPWLWRKWKTRRLASTRS